MSAWLLESPGHLVLTVHVQPGARRTEVVGTHGDALKIKLAARGRWHGARCLDRIPGHWFRCAQTTSRTGRRCYESADGLGALILAHAPRKAETTVAAAPDLAVIGEAGDAFARALAAGATTLIAPIDDLGARLSALVTTEAPPAHLVYPVSGTADDEVEALARHIEAIKTIAEALDAAGCTSRVTIATSGGLDGDAAPSALASGIRGFLRVAINEFPNVDLRLADFSRRSRRGGHRRAARGIACLHGWRA